jgi:hypothetical protein
MDGDEPRGMDGDEPRGMDGDEPRGMDGDEPREAPAEPEAAEEPKKGFFARLFGG